MSTDTAMKSAATTEGIAVESTAKIAPEPAAIEPATIITIMAAEKPAAVVVRIGVAIAVWVVIRLVIRLVTRLVMRLVIRLVIRIRIRCEWIIIAMKAKIYPFCTLIEQKASSRP